MVSLGKARNLRKGKYHRSTAVGSSGITNALQSTTPRFGGHREKSQAESLAEYWRKQRKQDKTKNENIPESCAIPGVRPPPQEEACGTCSYRLKQQPNTPEEAPLIESRKGKGKQTLQSDESGDRTVRPDRLE